MRYPSMLIRPTRKRVALFHGICHPPAIKIYSGGLGLSGSHLRSAYELRQNPDQDRDTLEIRYYDQARNQDQNTSGSME